MNETGSHVSRAQTFGAKEFQERTGVSDHDLARLEIFADVLTQWQQRMNLVSRSSMSDLWSRHMLDSAQLKNHLRGDDKSILDLGSGAGFPGLVLGILTPGPVHLVESHRRKCAFLREAARLTDANVVVHNERIEQLDPFFVDVVTARALAPLTDLLAYAAPFLAENSRCLLLKGAKVRQELTDSRKKWNMIVTEAKSLSDSSGTVLIIEGISQRHDRRTH
ncbi:MAG: 16S rRNA (guanine(527)-N(7))-methyltransferase RsmG [Rhodospirillales bacterium]